MPTACSSTAAAPTPARSSARPGRTACRSNRRPSSRATSALRPSPTTAGSGRTSDRARARRSRSSSRAATGPIRTRWTSSAVPPSISGRRARSSPSSRLPSRAARSPCPIGPLRLLDASTGDVRTILDGPVVAFYWAPDGDTIAALQVATPGDDNVAEAAGIVLARAAVTRAPAGRPAAVAPGLALRLVFVDVASGAIRAQRSVQVGDDFAGQQLPFFDQYALSHRVWSAGQPPHRAARGRPGRDDAHLGHRRRRVRGGHDRRRGRRLLESLTPSR